MLMISVILVYFSVCWHGFSLILGLPYHFT